MDRALQSFGTAGEFFPPADSDQQRSNQPENFTPNQTGSFTDKLKRTRPNRQIGFRNAIHPAGIKRVRNRPRGVCSLNTISNAFRTNEITNKPTANIGICSALNKHSQQISHLSRSNNHACMYGLIIVHREKEPFRRLLL